MSSISPAQRSLNEGKRLYSLKRWEPALKELLAIKTDSFSAEETSDLAYYLGLCYTKLARYEDGLLYLEQVITTSDDTLRICQCRMTLAYIYVITRRYKMAEFELNHLVKSGFESVQIYTTLAYAAYGQKDYDKALELYEKALEMDMNNTTALNGIGYILIDRDKDLIRGLRLCKRAVDLKPQSAAYMDSLGWAYFKSGNIVEGRAWLRRALDAAPESEAIRTHMRVVVDEANGINS